MMTEKNNIIDNENLMDEFEEEINCSFCKTSSTKCCINTEKFVTLPPCKPVVCEEVDTELNCLGRILKAKVNLDNLCPCKRVTVAVLIFEDNKLLCFKVGKIKTGSNGCNIKKTKEFCFALEDNDLCRTRNLKIQIVANYSTI
jgi:hypothetical protein